MNILLTNAKIYTSNPKQPRASAIAIANDRIVAVGSDSDVANISLPNLQRVNMNGAFVTPGLIDAHLHLEKAGFAMQNVDVFELPTKAETLARVRERAAVTPKGEWIRGWGFLHTMWGNTDFPTAQELDAATSDHPVVLTAKSGHGIWANSMALKVCGITRNTEAPFGGEIVHDANGEPSGTFLETATDLIYDRIPEPSFAQKEQAVIDVMHAMNKKGLTGVHCMDGKGGIDTFNTYQRVRQRGAQTLRVVKNLPAEDLDAIVAAGIRNGFGDVWLKVGGIKFFSDGALGQRTAAMLEPYLNDGDNRGIVTYEQEALIEAYAKCFSNGLSCITHCIGDRANRNVLDAIEIASKEAKMYGAPLRNRIEHAQHLHPDDIARFAQLNVIASVQPIHATQDMFMTDKQLGEKRAQSTYAFRSLINAGAKLALGSDSPVETFDPMVGIHAALTRRRADGTPGANGWHGEQRLTIDEALYGYTIGAAYAGGCEQDIGSLEVGKLADLTVLDHDLTQMPADDILKVKATRVMVNGVWMD